MTEHELIMNSIETSKKNIAKWEAEMLADTKPSKAQALRNEKRKRWIALEKLNIKRWTPYL